MSDVTYKKQKKKNTFGNSFRIAFLMYSRIPMPQADWEAANMRYVMCFFPLVGAAIGAVVFGVSKLCAWLSVPALLTAIVLILLPILISGGIHLDGFMDVCDAVGSRQEPARKLEIMKDSHVGSFAVLGLVVLLLLNLGAWYEIPIECLQVLGIGFVLSRAMSGYLVIREKAARKDGLNAMFSGAAEKNRTKIVLWIYMAACVVFMLIASVPAGIAACVVAFVCLAAMPQMAKRQFGGWTGDVAGYFLQICEVAMAIAAVVVWHIVAG
ncbi:MAG: adenosylcobinamide-GDP ribazoletransferase [Lachnospiraceae bacterium]|nr:adenosylcobinamide-GDP ribazoletransferase [Lachnospiraceae bacterium]